MPQPCTKGPTVPGILEGSLHSRPCFLQQHQDQWFPLCLAESGMDTRGQALGHSVKEADVPTSWGVSRAASALPLQRGGAGVPGLVSALQSTLARIGRAETSQTCCIQGLAD